jgi:hypothetical protein
MAICADFAKTSRYVRIAARAGTGLKHARDTVTFSVRGGGWLIPVALVTDIMPRHGDG